MSVKIYEAYRAPADADLWPLLWSIKKRGQAEARARLALAYRDVLDGRAQARIDWYDRADAALRELHDAEGTGTAALNRAVLDGTWDPSPVIGPKPASVLAVSDAEISQHLGGQVRRPTLRDVDRFVAKRYGEQLNDPHRGKWNLDVAVHVRVAGRWAYMIPICDCASLVATSLDFLREMPGLQSYGFWDSTERPKGVSRREWERRETVWRAMLEPDRWGDCASLEIVTWIRFAEVSPAMDLAAEYRERQPAEVSQSC